MYLQRSTTRAGKTCYLVRESKLGAIVAKFDTHSEAFHYALQFGEVTVSYFK